MKYLILFLLLQYFIDISTSNCNSIIGEILLLIHHVVFCYMCFGGLFNPLYHLIFLIMTLIHWRTNNNKCFLTVETNKYCGYPEDREFRDFFYYIYYYTDLDNKCPNIEYLILMILAIYDIYNIFK